MLEAVAAGLIVEVVMKAGAKGGRVLQIVTGPADPDEQSNKVLAKTFETLKGQVSPNSLRILLILRRERHAFALSDLRTQVAELALTQEPHGDPIESDIKYRMRFLQTLGLVRQVGGSDFALTHLGYAFTNKAELDQWTYGRAFVQ